MKKIELYCDCCDKQIIERSDLIQSVELSVGGNGAMTAHYWADDMCNTCYGNLIGQIGLFIKRK